MYNHCFCPRLVIQCFLVQPMLNVGTVGLYIVFILVKDLLDFKCYFLALCFKFQPISYVHILYNCYILLSCAKFFDSFEFFQRWQQKMWGGGMRLEYQLVSGGGRHGVEMIKILQKMADCCHFLLAGTVRGQVGQRIWRTFVPVGPVPTLC